MIGKENLASDLLRLLGVTAIYAALTAIVTYPQIRHFSGGILDDIDAYFNIWRLAWIAHQLPHHPLQLFEANIFYPEHQTGAYSDALIGSGIAAAPLFWLGVNPILIHNLLLFAGFALSGLAMFVLVEQLTRSTTAALISGALFAISPYRLGHYVQLELQTVFMPIALLALHRTITARRCVYALAIGISVALQIYSGIYYGVYFATFLCLLAPLLVLVMPASGRPRVAQLLVASALLAALLVLPYMIPYLAARGAVGMRSISETLYYSATRQDYLTAPPGNALYDGWLAAGWRGNFPGVVVVLCAAIALWPPISRTAIAYLIAGAFAFDASLGLHGYTFQWLRDWVLPYRGLRLPSRFAVLVVLSLVVLAGIGIARIAVHLDARGRALLVTLALVAAVLEGRTPHKLAFPPSSAAVVDKWLRQQPPSAIVELPLPPPDQPFDIVEGRHVYDSIFHWQRLANGYSGFWPRSYLELLERMRTFPDQSSVGYLQRLGIRFVVVRSALFTPTEFRQVSDALRDRPQLAFVGRMPEKVGESFVYEVSTATR